MAMRTTEVFKLKSLTATIKLGWQHSALADRASVLVERTCCLETNLEIVVTLMEKFECAGDGAGREPAGNWRLIELFVAQTP